MIRETEVYVIRGVEISGADGEYFASCKIEDKEISGSGGNKIDALADLQASVEFYIHHMRDAGESLPSCVEVVNGIALTVIYSIEDTTIKDES